jgi:hypothetical protein
VPGKQQLSHQCAEIFQRTDSLTLADTGIATDFFGNSSVNMAACPYLYVMVRKTFFAEFLSDKSVRR